MSKSISTCGTLTSAGVEEGTRLFVLTGHYQAFRVWCREHGLDTRDGHSVWFMSQPMQARGLRYKEEENAFVLGNLFWDARHRLSIMDIMRVNGFEAIIDEH